MRTKLQKISLAFLLFSFFTISTSTWSAEVVSISITAKHYGIGGFDGKSNFHIQKELEGYKGTLVIVDTNQNFKTLLKEGLFVESKDSSNGQESLRVNTEATTQEEVFRRLKNDFSETSDHSIPTEKIDRFIQSLTAPPKTSLDISQFGINEEWLRSIATNATEKWLDPTKGYYFILKSRQQNLIEKLSNVENANRKIFLNYSYSVVYDDQPELEAVITYSDGQTINLSSKSQHEFMIPWKIKANNKQHTTYDIRVSKALDMLLPEKFLEKERIKGNLFKEFKDRFWSDEILGWKNTAASEYSLRDQIDFIKNEFLIINGRVDHEYKKGQWELSENGKWELTLSHKNWPKNVFVSTDIPYLSGQLKNEIFSPERIHLLIKKLTEVKWLKKYIQNHPYEKFYVNIFDYRSITAEDFLDKIKQLKRNQNYEWKSINLSYHEDIILFTAHNEKPESSCWLIFQDNSTTLHSFRGERVLNWSNKELSRWKKFSTHYSGARISPDGEIMRPQ
jgi:hypothetical protein